MLPEQQKLVTVLRECDVQEAIVDYIELQHRHLDEDQTDMKMIEDYAFGLQHILEDLINGKIEKIEAGKKMKILYAVLLQRMESNL